MIKKRVNKINWHGSDLENNRAKAPNISSPGGNGLDGLNDGEIYVCNADEDPAIFIKTNKDKVARVGGNGSDSYSRDQIDDFLGKKLDKVVWDRNLEERVDDNGEEYLFLTKPLITAYGVTMYAGADVQVPSIYEGLPIDGVTIQWIDGKLVSTGGKGTANGIVVNGNTYTPNEDGIITLPNYPTSLEWDNISGKPSWIGSTKPSYSWDEIGGKPSVFPTNWENVSGKPSWIGATKPTYDFSEIQNKPTTIAGYGITDAYTKNDISGLLADYVTRSGAQDITGIKSFINGLNIGDILVKKHSDGVVELDGDLILTGSLTMFAQGSHTASTILDALPIDNTTLSKEGDVLSVIGGVGGGSVDGIILNGTTYSPDEATKLITLPNYPTTLPASDVYSWAKQPNKPSYSFGELSSHPTTLGGYGITDAYTKSDADSRYRQLNTSQFYGDEISSYYWINRASDGGGGWAYSPIRMYKGDKASQILNIGAMGQDSNISFVFIGSQDYGNRNNLRIYPDGDVFIGSSLRAVSPVSDALWQFGYSNTSFSGIVMHDISQHNNVKALYIQTNGYDARSDTGGLAITNDCVTAFGAGDNGSVFRVLNEGNVNLGALFNVAGDGTLTRLGNKIWDAGNDGSGSGLDADLLDGKHLHQGQWDSICYIGGDGVLEIGKYIDFHEEQGMSKDFSCRIMSQGDYQNTLFLPTSSGTLATLGDNVASATRLATSRSIYGNPFDGTSDIPVTAIGKMRFLYFTKDDGSELGYVGKGSDHANNFEFINYEGSLVLGANKSDDVIITTNHNVGIGTPSPAFKLHVNGDIGVVGTIDYGYLTGGNERNLLYQQMADNDFFRIRCGGPSNQGWVEIATADDGTEPIYVRQYTGEFASITRTLTLLDGNGDTYCPGKITSGNWIRSNLYSAGIDGYTDDLYSAAYNACAPNNDNYCCYSIVRAGIIPLGIGFNTNNEIWLGTANTNRKADAQWLQISGNQVTCSGNLLAKGGITMYSDLRKKNVLNSIIVPLGVMANADLFDYTFKTDEKCKVRAGTSAQYWNVFLPQVTDTDNEGFFTMSYDVLATTCVLSIAKHFQRFLIEDFNNHETRIEFLERENKELKDSNKEMMNRIIELERRAA